MITVHHLNHSRSLRILWLLEELGLAYELVEHARDPATRLAPPSLEAVHPLGKSPVLVADGQTVFESGAIIAFVLRRYGEGRLTPPVGSAEYDAYEMWLHYAEGSAMLPLMLNLYVTALGGETDILRWRIDSELARHLGYIETQLATTDYLVGSDFTAADIQMSFIGEMVRAMPLSGDYPAIVHWLERIEARPAHARAVELGGANRLAAHTNRSAPE